MDENLDCLADVSFLFDPYIREQRKGMDIIYSHLSMFTSSFLDTYTTDGDLLNSAMLV